MTTLWETSESLTADCDRGVNDEPFFIPVSRRDIIQLRLVVPYSYVALNGNGLPIGANLNLKAYNEAGTSVLCDYSDPTIGRFLYSYTNDGTNKVAEYQMFFCLGFKDEDLNEYGLYSVDATAGQVVYIDTGTTVYQFIYGVDEIPMPLVEWKAGSIAFVLTNIELGASTFEVGGTPVIPDAVTSSLICGHEEYKCFRFRLAVTFATLGQTINFWTKPFKVVRCDDVTMFLQGEYPAGLIDCGGHKHEGTGGDQYKNRHYLRVPGYVEDGPVRVTKSYNSRKYCYRTDRVETAVAKSTPMPKWYCDAIQVLLEGQNTRIDGKLYDQEESQTFFENIDLPGQKYNVLNVNLQSSKCEKVFVCQ